MLKINENELDIILKMLQDFKGHELSEVLLDGDDLALGFFGQGKLRWIYCDLNNMSMVLMPLAQLSKRFSRGAKPLALFMKSNLTGQILTSIEKRKEFGRVVRFNFDSECWIEVRLFPKGKNIIANFKEKSVALYKPKELIPQDLVTGDYEVRDFETIKLNWMALKSSHRSTAKESPEVLKKARLKKLNKALIKSQRALGEMLLEKWLKLAQQLEVKQSLQGTEFDELLDLGLSVQQNILRAYEKHKKQKGKIQNQRIQVENLLGEIKAVEEGAAIKAKKPSVQMKLFEMAKAKGRRKQLSDGVIVSVGKSAKDNINLLKKSKAWFIWMHIKDTPSAHAFIELPKKTAVSPGLLKSAAEFLLENSLKESLRSGKWEVIYTECRYVQPIKGDKVGRVKHQNEKSIWVTL